MSLPPRERTERQRLLQLMAYADGELDPEELADLEAELAREPAGRAVVQAFHGLGEHVRTDVIRTPPDLTDAIMSHLQSAETSHDRPLPVGARRSDPVPHLAAVPLASSGPMNMNAPVRQPQVIDLNAARARRFKLVAAVASMAAVAAAVALFIARPAFEGALAPSLAAAALGVQVQNVDSQEKVTVFSIPALNSNASSVVVWVEDEEDQAAAAKDAGPP